MSYRDTKVYQRVASEIGGNAGEVGLLAAMAAISSAEQSTGRTASGSKRGGFLSAGKRPVFSKTTGSGIKEAFSEADASGKELESLLERAGQ